MAHLVFRRDPDVLPTNKLSIYGRPRLKAGTLRAYAARRNPEAPDVAEMYLRQAEPYGIRGDLAYCQAMLDTQTWTAEPQGPPWKPFAYAIWGGLAYSDRSEEELARRVDRHLQKLSAIVDSHKTDEPCWEDLGGRWAVSDWRYGHDIVAIWRNMQNWKGSDRLNGEGKLLSGSAAKLSGVERGTGKATKLSGEESEAGSAAKLSGDGRQSGGPALLSGNGRETDEAEVEAAVGSSVDKRMEPEAGRIDVAIGMQPTDSTVFQADRTAGDHLSWLSAYAWVPTPPPHPGRKVSWGELARVISILEKQRGNNDGEK